MSFPLRYARGNLLIGHSGESAGLYRLGMTSYPYLPSARSGSYSDAFSASPTRWPPTSPCGE